MHKIRLDRLSESPLPQNMNGCLEKRKRGRADKDQIIQAQSASDYFILVNQDLILSNGKVRYQVVGTKLLLYSTDEVARAEAGIVSEEKDDAAYTFTIPEDADISRIHAGPGGPGKTLVVLPRNTD